MAKLICIDPGHGGADPGAIGKARECDFNLTVALDLKRELEARGISVVMTRSSDITVSLEERCTICNTSNADLFLSIHANASNEHNAYGAEAYCWPGGVGATIAADLVNVLTPIMGVHGQAVKDGGPNGTAFYVIRKTNPPAVLVEVGYIDSSDFDKLANHLHDFGPLFAGPLSKFLGGVEPVIPKAPTNGNVSEALALMKNAIKILEG
jgi:N-acetylmuramoyl-L-alanine amidase